MDEDGPSIACAFAERPIVGQAGVSAGDVPARVALSSVEHLEKWSASSLRRHSHVRSAGEIDQEADVVCDGIEGCDAELDGAGPAAKVDRDLADGGLAVFSAGLDFSDRAVRACYRLGCESGAAPADAEGNRPLGTG